MGDNFKSG